MRGDTLELMNWRLTPEDSGSKGRVVDSGSGSGVLNGSLEEAMMEEGKEWQRCKERRCANYS